MNEQQPWWHDLPEIDQPVEPYLDNLAAHNDRLFAERRGNLCPVCAGSGTETIAHSYARDWETGEYLDTEEVPCGSCEDGLLFTPAELVVVDHGLVSAWLDGQAREFDQDTEAA